MRFRTATIVKKTEAVTMETAGSKESEPEANKKVYYKNSKNVYITLFYFRSSKLKKS
jgi:hypothetical protein